MKTDAGSEHSAPGFTQADAHGIPQLNDLPRLTRQIAFLLEIDRAKSIWRRNLLADASRRENDAEHAWHLAMMVLLLAEFFPAADPLRAMEMVLIHDLVEIDAGDVYAYDADALQGKAEREEAAARRIFAILPEDQGTRLYALWREFEKLESPEAVFAGIVDRLQPLLLNQACGGLVWLENQIRREQVIARNELTFRAGPEELRRLVLAVIDEAVRCGYLKP